MTLEQLLDASADQLEAMTDDELLAWAKPYLNVTRPDQVEKILVSSSGKKTTASPKLSKFEKEMDPVKLAKAKLMSEQFGLDLFS